MSLIGRIFNRKKQLKERYGPDRKRDFFHMEEEDPEEDELVSEESPKLVDPVYEEEETYEVLEREIQPAKIICPDCGGITLEGFEYCDKCGGELM